MCGSGFGVQGFEVWKPRVEGVGFKDLRKGRRLRVGGPTLIGFEGDSESVGVEARVSVADLGFEHAFADACQGAEISVRCWPDICRPFLFFGMEPHTLHPISYTPGLESSSYRPY